MVKPAYLLRGLSPALTANISAALRVRLLLALKKTTMTTKKIPTTQGQGNHQEGDAAKSGRDKSASMTMVPKGAKTGKKKVAFALPPKQFASGLPELKQLEGAVAATEETTGTTTTTVLTKGPRTMKTMLSPLSMTFKTKNKTTKSKRFPLLQTMAGIRREVAWHCAPVVRLSKEMAEAMAVGAAETVMKKKKKSTVWVSGTKQLG